MTLPESMWRVSQTSIPSACPAEMEDKKHSFVSDVNDDVIENILFNLNYLIFTI